MILACSPCTSWTVRIRPSDHYLSIRIPMHLVTLETVLPIQYPVLFRSCLTGKILQSITLWSWINYFKSPSTKLRAIHSRSPRDVSLNYVYICYIYKRNYCFLIVTYVLFHILDNVHSFFFLQLPLDYKVVEFFVSFYNIESTKTIKAHSLCCCFSTLKAKSHVCATYIPLIGFLRAP